MLLTAQEADGAFARRGRDPSGSVIEPSPFFHGHTHDMWFLVPLPCHANSERQCRRGLEKKMLNQSLSC